MAGLSKSLNHVFIKDPLTAIRLSRFVIVGIGNTVLTYVAFVLLVSSLDYLLSLSISYLVGIINSYVWNKYWTFESNRMERGEPIRFVSVYCLAFAANSILLYFLINYLDFTPQAGQIIVLPITTIISYCLHRSWSFKKVASRPINKDV